LYFLLAPATKGSVLSLVLLERWHPSGWSKQPQKVDTSDGRKEGSQVNQAFVDLPADCKMPRVLTFARVKK
jgi:hypothetical protein